MAGHMAHAAGVAIQAAFIRGLLLVLGASLLMTVGILLHAGLLVCDGLTVILPALAKGHRDGDVADDRNPCHEQHGDAFAEDSHELMSVTLPQ